LVPEVVATAGPRLVRVEQRPERVQVAGVVVGVVGEVVVVFLLHGPAQLVRREGHQPQRDADRFPSPAPVAPSWPAPPADRPWGISASGPPSPDSAPLLRGVSFAPSPG